MIFDLNIKIEGINDEFMEELDEFIEDTRIEYFLINPKTKEELKKVQDISNECQRFKYSMPIEFIDEKDDNCVAIKITQIADLNLVQDLPLVIESDSLTGDFIDILNEKGIKGVILNAKESDNKLVNFVYSISHDSVKNWTNKGMMDTDYNKLALQSDYPQYEYDELFDLLKLMSDMTFRAEQSIVSGSTRVLLKSFSLL
jgi:hypothetical protein